MEKSLSKGQLIDAVASNVNEESISSKDRSASEYYSVTKQPSTVKNTKSRKSNQPPSYKLKSEKQLAKQFNEILPKNFVVAQ